MMVKSPSMQRTNSCWSWTVKATSPSPSMLGSRPSSIRASSTRPRRGCSLGGGGKFGSEVGSVMCQRYRLPTLDAMAATPDLAPPLGATLTREGVDFAVYAGHADAVEICLFEPGDLTGASERRVSLK